MKNADPATNPNMVDSLMGLVRPMATRKAPETRVKNVNQIFFIQTDLVWR